MKVLLESKIIQNIGENPIEFLGTHYFPNGKYVSIGYFNDKALSWGEKGRKRITSINDAQLAEYIKILPEGEFKNSLIAFRESPKYQGALGYSNNSHLIEDPEYMKSLPKGEERDRLRAFAKTKTAPLIFGPNCHIIKIGRFILNWRSNSSLGRFYDRRREEEIKVRAKHGFDGTPGTWRDNIKTGNELQPRLLRNQHGNVYTQPLGNDTGFWINPDHEASDEIAIRLIGNPKSSRDSLWYFVDNTGNMMEIDKNVMAFLCSAYSATKTDPQEVVREINAEEEAFLKDLQSIRHYNDSEMTLLVSQIIYMAGTGIDVTSGVKKKDQYVWKNDVVLQKRFPWLSNPMFERIYNECINKSAREVAAKNKDLDNSTNTVPLPESLERRIMEKPGRYIPIYENMMGRARRNMRDLY